jgi:hypothetical protein
MRYGEAVMERLEKGPLTGGYTALGERASETGMLR